MQGKYTIFDVNEQTRVWKPVFEHHNLFLHSWGFAAARALGLGDSTYQINGFYVEFENSATPGAIAVPSFDATAGLSYYNNLGSNKDFLRIPLLGTPVLDQDPDFVDILPAEQKNRLQFLGQTSGTEGVLGEAFSEANDSVVYGLALIAAPSWGDRSQDVLIARSYYPTGQQKAKVDGFQIGIQYRVTFKEGG